LPRVAADDRARRLGASSIVPASARPSSRSTPTDLAAVATIDCARVEVPRQAEGVDSIKRDLSKEGVSWEQDVEPSLQGELDFVWLDFERTAKNFVAPAQPKDEAKFKALVAKANKPSATRAARRLRRVPRLVRDRARPGGDRPLRAAEQRAGDVARRRQVVQAVDGPPRTRLRRARATSTASS
jgi:hypothetical protein